MDKPNNPEYCPYCGSIATVYTWDTSVNRYDILCLGCERMFLREEELLQPEYCI